MLQATPNQAHEYTISFTKNKAHLCISNNEKAFISSMKRAFAGNIIQATRGYHLF